MVYNTQNHWVAGLCPSYRIPNRRNNSVSETGCVSFLSRGGEIHLLCWAPLQRADLNHWLHWTETDPVSETLCSLVFRIPDDELSPETQWFWERTKVFEFHAGVLKLGATLNRSRQTLNSGSCYCNYCETIGNSFEIFPRWRTVSHDYSVTHPVLPGTCVHAIRISCDTYNRTAVSIRGLPIFMYPYCVSPYAYRVLVCLLWMVHEIWICPAVHQRHFLTTQDILLVCFLEYEMHRLKRKNPIPRESY
jgi:hypothetical protein